MTRLEQQMNFIREVDKEKRVFRQTYLSDGSRKENDAEHSWHLALMCMLLHEYANEKIDVSRTMCMVLIHDLIEIDAGDTYAYDDAGNKTKRERELKAAERLFGLLPADQAEWIRGLWDEFEEGGTPEARFAANLDRIQPTMLNDASEGKSWEEHGVTMSQILKRNAPTASGSRVLWEYALEHFIRPNVEKGKIVEDTDGLSGEDKEGK